MFNTELSTPPSPPKFRLMKSNADLDEFPEAAISIETFNQLVKSLDALFVKQRRYLNQQLVFKSIREAKRTFNINDALWEQMEPELEAVPIFNDDGSTKKPQYTRESIERYIDEHKRPMTDPIFRNMN